MPAPFAITPGLFDQSQPRTLGLPVLPVRDARVYEATETNWRFSHTANLAAYGGRLHLMWSNGEIHEDSDRQRLLHATSTDEGVTWSSPRVLLTPEDVVPGEPRGALMSAGWGERDGRLLAYATWSHGAKFHDASLARLWRIESTDGESWSAPVPVAAGTYLEGPRQVGPRDWVLLGQGAHHQPTFFHASHLTEGDGWQPVALPAALPTQWPEPSCYLRPDGSVVATLRVGPAHAALFGCESGDGGRTWSAPEVTTFPSATARTAAGNLPDGTAFLVANPNTGATAKEHPTHGSRQVLALALSRDGRVFDRAFALLVDPPMLKFSGHAKMGGWQYPNALVWRDRLFIAYTVSKEDVGVLSIALADLGV